MADGLRDAWDTNINNLWTQAVLNKDTNSQWYRLLPGTILFGKELETGMWPDGRRPRGNENTYVYWLGIDGNITFLGERMSDVRSQVETRLRIYDLPDAAKDVRNSRVAWAIRLTAAAGAIIATAYGAPQIGTTIAKFGIKLADIVESGDIDFNDIINLIEETAGDLGFDGDGQLKDILVASGVSEEDAEAYAEDDPKRPTESKYANPTAFDAARNALSIFDNGLTGLVGRGPILKTTLAFRPVVKLDIGENYASGSDDDTSTPERDDDTSTHESGGDDDTDEGGFSSLTTGLGIGAGVVGLGLLALLLL